MSGVQASVKFKPEWVAQVRVGRDECSSLSSAIIHPDLLADLLHRRRYGLLADFANIIVEGRALAAPTHVFKGLNRPLHSEGTDNFVFIYVCKPRFRYIFSRPNSPADVIAAPANSVFVTYVTLNRVMMTELQTLIQAPPQAFRGIILGWEWVMECRRTAGLPIDHATRYKGRLWK